MQEQNLRKEKLNAELAKQIEEKGKLQKEVDMMRRELEWRERQRKQNADRNTKVRSFGFGSHWIFMHCDLIDFFYLFNGETYNLLMAFIWQIVLTELVHNNVMCFQLFFSLRDSENFLSFPFMLLSDRVICLNIKIILL